MILLGYRWELGKDFIPIILFFSIFDLYSWIA